MLERRARARARAETASKQRLRLWIRLLRAARTVEGELRERLRLEFGETLPRFDALAALERNRSGMTMTELSRSLMVSNGNITGIVERLVAAGLVVRLAHADDRRAIFVRLTPKGVEQFLIMAKAHEAWVAQIFAGLSGAETERLMALLGALPARLDAERVP